MQVIAKNNKKTIRSWAMFDWANSVYNLVITSTIFPAYYLAITTGADGSDRVSFFGIEVINTVLSNYALAASYLLMSLALPFLSAYADAHGKKLTLMKLFTYIGAVSCMGLFFFTIDTLEISIIFFALAAMGYIGGVAMNNSYLPLIATPDQQDEVSAKGFAYGYVGCVILQLLCFVLIFKKEWFGINDSALPAQLSFLLVGLWWLGFSQIPFAALPPNRATRVPGLSLLKRVRSEFESVRQRIQKMDKIRRFLPAFFFSAVGVQTIMIVASAFGEKVLQLGATKLVATIISIQLVAILGAKLMAVLTRYYGNIAVLLVVIFLWGCICVAAYFLNSEWQFYILAFMVGLLMGGIQSLSRSTYSKLLPEDLEDTTAFFSFYDVAEKVAIVVGLFSFGFIEHITENIRLSALFLSVFFVLSLFLMARMMKYNTGLKS